MAVGDDATEQRTLDYAGQIVYRLASDAPPGIMENGDPHSFCFDVPEGTVHIKAHLAWNPPKPLAMEFYWTGGSYRSWSLPLDVADLPPIEAEFNDVTAGKWSVYIGPLAADVMVDWSLTLTLEVPAANVTLEKTSDC